jgi:hypothetical protein
MEYHALDRNIIAVATLIPSSGEKHWGAYIGIVDGRDHDSEQLDVVRRGTRLRENIAKALFPAWSDWPYALTI